MDRSKKALSLALATVMTLLILFPAVWTAAAESAVWDGSADISWHSGSQSEFTLATAEQLAGLAQLVNAGNDFNGKTVKLAADILLNDTAGWENWGAAPPAHAWTPAGDNINHFAGTFDGQDYEIRGLYIDSASDYQGLFGYVGAGGTVKRVAVAVSRVTGGTFTGGVAGFSAGALAYCRNAGAVFGYMNVGGVAGYSTGTLKGSVNSGAVGGTYQAIGGVAGMNYNGTVELCQNSGAVGGSASGTGGVTGGNQGTLRNSYNTGAVSSSGEDYTGGVTGWNEAAHKLTNCYSTGNISGSGSFVGGVAGINVGFIQNSYYQAGTAGTATTNHSVGSTDRVSDKTAAEMKDAAFAALLGAAFTRDILNLNGGYPAILFAGGAGTPESPYEIATRAQLYRLATLVNDHNADFGNKQYELADHIHLGAAWDGEGALTGGAAWTPIGNQSKQFAGTFDGQGFTVSGLYISVSGAVYNQGLFGYIGAGGTVKNTGVAASYIKGPAYVGGIAGCNAGRIENCRNGAYVEASQIVGGIAGEAAGGSVIEKSGNTGEIRAASQKSGGIVGYGAGTVGNCFNAGAVSAGVNQTGGVVGFNRSGGLIENSYNTGTVSGALSGGMAGSNNGGSTIRNCYSTGTVSGDLSGGVAGINSDSTIADCYYLTGSALRDIGGTPGNTAGRSEAAFIGGEAAWLLQGSGSTLVWGHTALNGTQAPLLAAFVPEAVRVVRVRFWGDGEEETPLASAYALTGGTVSFPTPSSESHHLTGWRDGGENPYTESSAFSADTDLYAQWQINTYTVTLPAGAGFTAAAESGSASPVAHGGSYSFKIALDAAHSQSAITVRANGSALTPANGVYTITGIAQDQTVTVEGVTVNTYAVTLHENGGTIAAGEDVGSYTHGTGAALPGAEDISKTGHVFGGWYASADLSGPAITAISGSDSGDKEYWAKWAKKQYTLKFDANGGSTVADRTVYYGDTVNLPAPTRANYHFDGWYGSETGGNGSGTQFTASPVQDLGEDGAQISLYAKWTAKTAVAHTPAVQTVTYGTSGAAYTVTHGSMTGFAVRYLVGGSWSAAPPVNAGKYDIQLTRNEDDTYASYDSSVLPEYFVIAPAVLTVSVKPGLTISKTYDGGASVGGVQSDWLKVNGLKNGETAAATGTWSYADPGAGTGKAVNITGIAIQYGTADSDNYTYTYAALSSAGTVENAAQSATSVSIDFIDETVDTTALMEYSANGTDWSACTPGMAVAESWFGENVCFRLKAKPNHDAGAIQTLAVPARPGTPAAAGSNETACGQGNGSISGVGPSMEYKIGENGQWRDITGTALSGLAPGTYFVRVKAADASFKSDTREIVIQSGGKLAVTFDTGGGSAAAAAAGLSYNDSISAPAVPVKDGYAFRGWYRDSAFESAWDFDADKVTENTTLYAKWVEAQVRWTAGGAEKEGTFEEALNETAGGGTITFTKDLTLPADVTVAEGVTLVIESGVEVTVSGSLTVNGTLVNNGSLHVTGTGGIANTGIFTNGKTGSVQNDGSITNSGSATNGGNIVNNGSLVNSKAFVNGGTVVNGTAGTVINRSGGTFTNNRTIGNEGTLTNETGAVFVKGSGSAISGNGTVTGIEPDSDGDAVPDTGRRGQWLYIAVMLLSAGAMLLSAGAIFFAFRKLRKKASA